MINHANTVFCKLSAATFMAIYEFCRILKFCVFYGDAVKKINIVIFCIT